jgi:hypothetical protein
MGETAQKFVVDEVAAVATYVAGELSSATNVASNPRPKLGKRLFYH